MTYPLHTAVAIKVSVLARGISQSKLARGLGWSQPQVSLKLSNRRPITLEDLYQLAEVLRVFPSDLVPDAPEAERLFRWAKKHKPNALPEDA